MFDTKSSTTLLLKRYTAPYIVICSEGDDLVSPNKGLTLTICSVITIILGTLTVGPEQHASALGTGSIAPHGVNSINIHGTNGANGINIHGANGANEPGANGGNSNGANSSNSPGANGGNANGANGANLPKFNGTNTTSLQGPPSEMLVK